MTSWVCYRISREALDGTTSTLGKLLCSGNTVDDAQTSHTGNKDTDGQVHVEIRTNLFRKM